LNRQKVCGISENCQPRARAKQTANRTRALRHAIHAATALLLLCSLPVSAAWEEKYYNPKPAADDLILPMPCDGAMAFRQVRVPLTGPLEDYAITVGQDSGDWGYMEQARPAHIAGSFTISKPEAARYYLLAKYELNQLQYEAITASTCPSPAAKLRLPQTGISWFDAMNFADRYSLWLRKNAATKLPKEDGVPGFLRLPTEVEWEFAARGGIAVSPAEFRDVRFPMAEGMNGYVWFAGAQSSNGKLQFAGLLNPNPLGLHDILGNADEMAFEPFHLNKLDRLHGQAGGYVVRGGSYLTPQAELRSALRLEQPYYSDAEQHKQKTTGMRLALVAPALTSRERVQQIEKDWNRLGQSATADSGSKQDALEQLGSITSGVQDDAVKKQLEKLRGDLRANIQARDEQRDQAIRSSLQLGAFLCTKLKDDGKFLDFLAKHHSQNCADNAAPSESCNARKQKLDEHQQVLDFILNYYADTVVDAALTYDKQQVEPQISVTAQQMTARGKNNLRTYLDSHWKNLQGYLDSGKIARQQWLESCKSI
jgi:hypothetical protein